MESPKKIVEIIRRREKLLEDITEDFIRFLERAQNNLYREILSYIKDLETSGKQLNANNANIKMAFRLRDQIRTFLRKHGYYQKIRNFGDEYDKLVIESRNYYKAISLSSVITNRDLEVLKDLRAKDVAFMFQNDERIMNETFNLVRDSIYTRTDFTDLADRLKNMHTDTVIKTSQGKEVKLRGLLKRYNATYAANAYAAFDRNIQNIKSAQLGLQHFLYSGGLIKDSRNFCIARAGKTYTKKQIDSWESLNWKGKITYASVWTALGGHDCFHVLTPITPELAKTLPNLYKS